MYNPTSSEESWIHKEWFIDGEPIADRLAGKDSDTHYLHSTYLDNLDNLAESTIKGFEKRKRTDPTYYANTIMAEWTIEVSGRIYSGWGEYDSIPDEDLQEWYGLDFAYGGKDETALIFIQYKMETDTYFVQEVFCEDFEIHQTWQKMKELKIPFNAKIYADSAMPNLLKDIRRNGFTKITRATKGNVDEGIKLFRDKNVVMVGGKDKNPKLYRAYMTFKRKDTGKLPHEPDTLAAARYGINSHRVKRNKPTKDSRKTFGEKTRERGGYM